MFIFRKKLIDICRKAVKEGRKIDLTGCNYGETDGCCRFIARPTSYYYFLAGLVKTQHLTYILESGTHCGGSILSMARGLNRRHILKSRLVTVDVEQKNPEGLKDLKYIKRVQGDSASDDVSNEVVRLFNRPIDLLYVDSLHEYSHTKKVVDIYSERLKPKYVVLDDINLSEPMRRLWSEIVEKFGKEALDVSEIVGRRNAGFGIVRLT